MAKKLTGQQRQELEKMKTRLLKVLPASERGFAAGIASGLVRTADPYVTEADLDGILADKCGSSASEGLRAAVVETLLCSSETQQGAYELKTDASGKPDADVPGALAEKGRDKSRGGHKTSFQKIPYIRRGDDADAEARQKILALDQRLWVNGWLLSHPGAYELYQDELEAISAALSEGAFPQGISRRQLAYRLGGNEKFFEYGCDGHKLLRAVGLDDLVRRRVLPKTDLVYFAPRRRKRMRVLVTENLDPYLDIRDSMYEEGRTLFLGERVHAVVLGGGTPVLERKRLVSLLDLLGADEVELFYWGDVDRAGVDILFRLRESLEGRYELRPFMPAYRLMLQRAMERFPDPEDNEETGQVNIELGDLAPFLAEFPEEQAAYVESLLEAHRLVPQEILTRQDL